LTAPAASLSAAAACIALCLVPPAGAEVPSPEQVLGFDPRAGGALIDPAQVEAYLQAAARASPLIRLDAAGLSVEGRPIWTAFVSSRRNVARLGEAIRRGERPVALATFGVHPLEVGSPLAALPFLHRLVAGESPRAREILEDIAVCVVPAVNPDGLDRVARWLRSSAGEPGRAPFIQHRFAGHDLNRDWVAGTQPETRALLAEVHGACRPWLTVDVHQTSVNGPRFFVPPYAQPIHPAVPAGLLAQAETLGGRVLADLTASGHRGGARRWVYDAWSPARCHPFYHGGVRFLVEVASARFAEPVDVDAGSIRVFHGNAAGEDHPAPWAGGRWGIPEITGTMIAAAEAAVGGLLDEPLRSGFAAPAAAPPEPAIEVDARGADPAVAAALLLRLEAGGARIVETDDGWLAADPEHGRGWSRALLTCAEYPADERAPAYDTTSGDLAHLAGVAARPAGAGAAAGTPPVRSPRSGRHRFLRPGALSARAGGGAPAPDARWLVSQRSLAIFQEIAGLCERGVRLARSGTAIEAGGIAFAPGDFIVDGATRAWVEHAVRIGASAAPTGPSPAEGGAAAGIQFEYPSILVLAGEPSQDEGWLRWVLEEHGFRFRAVTDVEAGLADRPFAVPGPFAPGSGGVASGRWVLLVPEGVLGSSREGAGDSLRAFVRGGGRVVAIGKSSRAVIEGARLPLRENGAGQPELPGTLLRAVAAGPGEREPLLWGYPAPPGVFYTGGPVWDAGAAREAGCEPVLLIHRASPRLCGLLRPEDAALVRGGAALVRIREGEKGGEWILFGFSPHFRAWTLGTYRLLFNAILAP
jgi:hypothetical protein